VDQKIFTTRILHNYIKDQNITGNVNVSSTDGGRNLTNLPHQRVKSATSAFSVREQYKMFLIVLLDLLAGKTNK
jgi:hypothetical protein